MQEFKLEIDSDFYQIIISDEEAKYQIDMWKSDRTETNVIKQIQL